MACDQIENPLNENYFVDVGDKNYKISNRVFEKNKEKLLKFDGDKIILAAEYYTKKPIKEHCYQFGLEKWHDWFTVPYYYLTNNIESQELKEILGCGAKPKKSISFFIARSKDLVTGSNKFVSLEVFKSGVKK